jgi:hypothetical protein
MRHAISTATLAILPHRKILHAAPWRISIHTCLGVIVDLQTHVAAAGTRARHSNDCLGVFAG